MGNGGIGACCTNCATTLASANGDPLVRDGLHKPTQLGRKLRHCCFEDIDTDEMWLRDYRLLSASAEGDLDVIREMLEQGANIEARRALIFPKESSRYSDGGFQE